MHEPRYWEERCRTLDQDLRELVEKWSRVHPGTQGGKPGYDICDTCRVVDDLKDILGMADKDQRPKPEVKIYKFSPGARWLDQPIEEMSAPFLRAALLYKIIELRECYNNMTMDQKRFVAGQMEKVEIPFDVIS